jgi:succinate dehydrogenase/fumarate reductase flavoprotein subunit
MRSIDQSINHRQTVGWLLVCLLGKESSVVPHELGTQSMARTFWFNQDTAIEQSVFIGLIQQAVEELRKLGETSWATTAKRTTDASSTTLYNLLFWLNRQNRIRIDSGGVATMNCVQQQSGSGSVAMLALHT